VNPVFTLNLEVGRPGGEVKPRIFIGSSSEALHVCDAVQDELARDFDVTVWDQDVFALTRDALDSLLAVLAVSDAGIFVLKPDDLTTSRGVSELTARDNVIFELGLFIGQLGRDRTYMLAPSAPRLRVPSDLLGLTVATYDAERFDRGEHLPAVAPACRRLRAAINGAQLRTAPESRSQQRLDRAMRRLSGDLENLLTESGGGFGYTKAALRNEDALLSLRHGRVQVSAEKGLIQNHAPSSPGAVVALPANEYFDDECINDVRSALGAYVQHAVKGGGEEFVSQVRGLLRERPSQRIARGEHRVADSYGIGEAVYMADLAPDQHVILVSVTTERTAIGLRAEPHFLYAAIEGVVEAMNEHRLTSLVIPVMGSGHGGMPIPIALLFNLLAIRSILADGVGRGVREITIVVYEGDVDELPEDRVDAIVERLSSN
jgi:hypothetical protein